MYGTDYEYKLIVLEVGLYLTKVIAEVAFETKEEAENEARWYRAKGNTLDGKVVTVIVDL